MLLCVIRIVMCAVSTLSHVVVCTFSRDVCCFDTTPTDAMSMVVGAMSIHRRKPSGAAGSPTVIHDQCLRHDDSHFESHDVHQVCAASQSEQSHSLATPTCMLQTSQRLRRTLASLITESVCHKPNETRPPILAKRFPMDRLSMILYHF